MNLTNYLKKGFISLFVLILGIVMLFAFGFNRGFDFTGGTIITVNATDYSESEAVQKVNNTLSDYNNIKVCDISVGTLDDEKIITIKYQITTAVETTNNAIFDDLYTQFGYDKTNIVEQKYISIITETAGTYNANVFVNAFLAVLVAVVACAIYIFARYGLTSAFAVIASAILDTATMLSIVLIFRLEISASIGYAIIATAVLSVIFNLFTINRLDSNSREEKYKKLKNAEIADITSREQIKQTLTFATSTIICLLILAIIATAGTSSAMIAVAFAVLAIVVSSLYITPNLWALAYVRRVRAKIIKKVETTAEEE